MFLTWAQNFDLDSCLPTSCKFHKVISCLSAICGCGTRFGDTPCGQGGKEHYMHFQPWHSCSDHLRELFCPKTYKIFITNILGNTTNVFLASLGVNWRPLAPVKVNLYKLLVYVWQLCFKEVASIVIQVELLSLYEQIAHVYSSQHL